MKYTAEEVRAIAKRLHDDITVADGDALMASDMLTAYAERIKAAQVDPAAKPHALADFVRAPTPSGHRSGNR